MKKIFTLFIILIMTSGTMVALESPEYANSLFLNFGDSQKWTNIVEVAPATGSFPTDTVAGCIFTSTAIVKAGRTLNFDEEGKEFVNFEARAHFDKNTYNSAIETPWVANIDTLYLYCNAGSSDKSCKIQTRVANGEWEDFTTIINQKTAQVFAVPVKKTNIKLRISNMTTTAQYFYYIGDTNPRKFATNAANIQNTTADANGPKINKSIQNGQIVIEKAGVKYNVAGQIIK